MKRFMLCLTAFGSGGGLYACCELLWRGWTHWSMPLAGGSCLVMILGLSGLRCPLWKKYLMSTAVITAVEYITGCIVNLAAGMRVWDYSEQKLNLMGQICPKYCVYWFLLSVPAVSLCMGLRKLFHTEEKRFSTAERICEEK